MFKENNMLIVFAITGFILLVNDFIDFLSKNQVKFILIICTIPGLFFLVKSAVEEAIKENSGN